MRKSLFVCIKGKKVEQDSMKTECMSKTGLCLCVCVCVNMSVC